MCRKIEAMNGLWRTVGLVLLMLPALSHGQQFHKLWQFDDVYRRSDFSAAAFIKNDRTVFVRSTVPDEEPWFPYNLQTVECFDAFGNSVWMYQMPDPGWSAKSILTTTDDRIYINFGYCILALNQDGQFVWRQNIPAGLDMRGMRIFGDKLFVVGEDRTDLQNRRATYFAFNRHTGNSVYSRLLLGPANSFYDEMKATVAHAFFKYEHPDGGSVVAKIDAATGDVVGSYWDPGRQIQRMTVDSQGMVYVGINKSSPLNWSLRKVNGSGTGSFTAAYDRTLPMHAGPICLSKGFLYTNSYGSGESYGTFFKIDPATGADVFSVEMTSAYEAPVSMSADKYGRLYMEWFHWRGGSGGGFIHSIDPATGERLHTASLSSYYDPTLEPQSSTSFAFNSNAELFVASGRSNSYGRAARYIQTMEPQPDAYSVDAGEVLTTNGNGVTANDRYVSPSLTVVSLVTPPALGTLTLAANGEFTYDATGVPPGPQSFTYRVARQTVSATQTATIAVEHGPFSLTLAKYVIAGQNSTLGTVRVSSPGPARIVTLADNSSLVSTPSSVTIPANQTSAGFRVQVQAVIAQINTTVFATLGNVTRSVPLRLTPLVPTAMQFTPSSTVVGGNTVSCRVVINGVAGPNGRVLSIYDNSNYCETPTQVVVPAGATSVTFEIPTTHPTSLQQAKITAAVTAGSCTATLRIVP